MWLSLCLLSALLLIVGAADNPIFYDLEQAEDLFEDFINTYNKTYESQYEKRSRLEIFKSNLELINEMNSKDGAVFGINKFTDLSGKEFEARYTGFRKGFGLDCQKVITDKDINTHDAPKSLNWVEKGAVTPIKDQEDCGSCWAFGTVGNIEGQYFLKHNQLKSFSEQQLIDCSKSAENGGCNGGDMITAMIDLMNMGGLQEESDYPYEDNDVFKCRFDKSKAVAKITGCTSYDLKNEDNLKEILAKTGPITIAVNGKDMQAYRGGIMTIDGCPSKPLDHAVLLVGYGTAGNIDYWLIKNSWGETFGENGYIRIKRGDNVCGLMNNAMCSADVA